MIRPLRLAEDIFHGTVRRMFIDAEILLAQEQGRMDGYDQGFADGYQQGWADRTKDVA